MLNTMDFLVLKILKSGHVFAHSFTGKEKDAETGYSYFGARYMDHEIMTSFVSVDRYSDKFPNITPYAYASWNPIHFIDINGDSTFVRQISATRYEVVGGTFEGNDNGIYMKDGNRITGFLGYSATPMSFYNSDVGKWMGTIDTEDKSGQDFLNRISRTCLGALSYAASALPGHKNDFKKTNGTNRIIYSEVDDYYRGMQISNTTDGKKIFASARDVGNIAAGFVAAVNGVIWPLSRTCFDGLESIQNNRKATEGLSTQFAEALGYNIGTYVYIQKRVSIPGWGIYRNMKRPEVMIKF